MIQLLPSDGFSVTESAEISVRQNGFRRIVGCPVRAVKFVIGKYNEIYQLDSSLFINITFIPTRILLYDFFINFFATLTHLAYYYMIR